MLASFTVPKATSKKPEVNYLRDMLAAAKSIRRYMRKVSFDDFW